MTGQGRDLDLAHPLDLARDEPLGPCCALAGADLRATRSIVVDGRYGYAIEPVESTCTCKAQWVPHDWRKGHAEFVPVSTPSPPTVEQIGR